MSAATVSDYISVDSVIHNSSKCCTDEWSEPVDPMVSPCPARSKTYCRVHGCTIKTTILTPNGVIHNSSNCCTDECLLPISFSWSLLKYLELAEGVGLIRRASFSKLFKELYGENWNEIAEHVATKTKAQCILHFVQMPIEDTFLESEDELDASLLGSIVPGSTGDDSASKDAPERRESGLETNNDSTSSKNTLDTTEERVEMPPMRSYLCLQQWTYQRQRMQVK